MAPDPASTDPATGTCDSCGDDDVAVVALRRLYLVPATDTEPQRFDPAGGVERWCYVCRTHYPHELVD
jgi:hypothetical protein